ncbi:MAG: hypothetical protein J0M15_16300 [Deltaproteobacteria bacterium]|jgi:hypothetical protein|nr:hypothetical protein [Deltaproteobacteria bacterium]
MKILKYIVSLAVLIQSSQVWSSAMSQAEKIITEQRKLAIMKAQEIVQMDLNFALTEVMEKVATSPDLAETNKDLFTSQQKLIQSYSSLLSQPKSENISEFKKQVNEAFEKYQELSREKFALSFIPSLQLVNRQKSLILAHDTLLGFENNCAVGKGIGGIGAADIYFPGLPKANYSIQLGFGTESGPSFQGSASASGTPNEQSRNQAANIYYTGATIVGSIAYSGASGAVVGACQMMAPYALAGGVVVALAVMYMSNEERIKAENEIVEAKMYVFKNSVDDRNIAQYYKDACQATSEKSKQLRSILSQSLNQPGTLSLPPNFDWEKEVSAMNKLSADRHQAYVELRILLEDQIKSPTNAELAQKIETKKNDIKKIEEALAKESTPERVANVLKAYLQKGDLSFHQQVQSTIWREIDLHQRKAFDRVSKATLDLSSRLFQSALDERSPIGMELAAQKSLKTAKLQFKKVLELKIKEIFGRADSKSVLTAQETLKTQAQVIRKKYGHEPEVAEFVKAAQSLIGKI